MRRWGLALHDRESTRRDDWIAVEQTTANEFMAALTLAVREELDRDHRFNQPNQRMTWVPTTDLAEAVQALLAGLRAATPADDDARLRLRVSGELAAAEIRTELLRDLLPVPTEPLPASKIFEFRRKHGSLLPDLRRHLESKIDEALAIEDEILRFRLLDRVRDQLEDQVSEAETYLRELSLKRISRSSILKILTFVPFLKDPIEAGQDLAESARTNPAFDAEPLAYLAFARTAFAPGQRLVADDSARATLVEALADRK
ncbi:DUF6236 family protein [Asanoa siamensis]|uniref:DUF6236 family protein n=1 Tax=Asanoa siamensis TaxID=926357 RepID=UPI0019431B0F|nr:DUF6236 family protein [Asanoa siamensis]